MAREDNDLLIDDDLAAFIDSEDLLTASDASSEGSIEAPSAEDGWETAEIETEESALDEEELPSDNLAVDVFETQDHLVVKARTAGLSGKDLNVEVNKDGILTIGGTLHGTDETDITGWHLSECYWGKFSRTIALPVPVKEKSAQASLKNGILTIAFEKEKVEESDVIPVKDL